MKNEWGASVLEYTILVSLVVLVVVGAMTALGSQINRTLPKGAASSSTTVTLVTPTTCPTSSTAAPTSTTTTSAPQPAC